MRPLGRVNDRTGDRCLETEWECVALQRIHKTRYTHLQQKHSSTGPQMAHQATGHGCALFGRSCRCRRQRQVDQPRIRLEQAGQPGEPTFGWPRHPVGCRRCARRMQRNHRPCDRIRDDGSLVGIVRSTIWMLNIQFVLFLNTTNSMIFGTFCVGVHDDLRVLNTFSKSKSTIRTVQPPQNATPSHT